MSEKNDTILTSSFQALGLDATARAIYINLLHKNPQKARSIGLDLDIPKTTVLEKLYELEKIGLVIKDIVKNSYQFYPENPRLIAQLLTQKEKHIEYVKNKSIQDILALEKQFNISKSSTVPTIEIAEGKEAIKKLYLKTLKSSTELITVGSVDEESRFLGIFAHDYWNLRANARVKTIAFMPTTNQNKDFVVKHDAAHGRISYFLNTDVSSPMAILLYENIVHLVSYEHETAITIDDLQVAALFRYMLQNMSVMSR